MNQDKRVIHIGARTEVIAQDIVLMQAILNYTQLFLSNGKIILVSYHLGKLQHRLIKHNSFIRPNRNTIVNLNFVTNYNENFIKINDTIVQISRRRKDIVSDYFKDFKNENRIEI